MNSAYAGPSLRALAARWWALMIRGVVAILFGILAIVAPGVGLLSLIMIWGAYAIVDGVFGLVLAARGARAGRRWGWLLFAGIVSIAAGLITFAWPGITAVVLLTMIAVWALFTGIAEIGAAIQLRRYIRGEWLLALSGVVSIVFSALLLLFPGAGALAIVWTIGTYAIVFGALLVTLGWRLHRWSQSHAASPA